MQTTTRRTSTALIATAIAALLALTGCANPIEKIVEEQTGVEIDQDGDGNVTLETEDGKVEIGSGTEMPADFPAELPTPTGVLTSSVTGGGGWTLNYEDVERNEVEQLKDHFRTSGYEEVSSMDSSDALMSGFVNEQWVVTLIWDGSGDSKALIYGVAPV
jgi:hypothetical protein